jgi:hypothetical protein
MVGLVVVCVRGGGGAVKMEDAMKLYATFERFELAMTLDQAQSASHPGECDADVAELMCDANIAGQLDAIGPDKMRDELREYGAWDAEELADDDANRRRVVWLAAGMIVDDPVTAEMQG